MADEKDISQGQEYQLPDDASVNEAPQEEVVDEQAAKKAKLARALIVAFVIVILYMLYNLFLAGDSSSKVETEKIQPVTTNQEEAKPVEEMPKKMEVMPEEDLADKFEPLHSKISTVEKNVNDINSKNQNLLGQVRELTNDVHDLHYQILMINEKLEKVSGMLEKKDKPSESKKAEIKKPLKVYFIRALIDGRAWIQDEQGNSITVKLGDKVDDYDVVQGIYPEQGVITTTSGRNIVYASGDN